MIAQDVRKFHYNIIINTNNNTICNNNNIWTLYNVYVTLKLHRNRSAKNTSTTKISMINDYNLK